MSIRFFLPRELYGVWNEAVRRYLTIISPEDGIELLAEGEGRDRFIAQLLGDYLSTEQAHHKASHNSEILERDGYQCQVPGCSNRRNLHAHHIEFRSQGGCDEPWNELCLCATHHLWILHYLHRLKIEGTAPQQPHLHLRSQFRARWEAFHDIQKWQKSAGASAGRAGEFYYAREARIHRGTGSGINGSDI